MSSQTGSSSHREQARNARVLSQALARIEQHLQQAPGQPMPLLPGEQVPPALGQLAHSLGLSPFERDALLLAVAPQLDARIGPLLAQAQGLVAEGGAGQPWMNSRLALALLAESRWEALTPVAPLRRWQLIELAGGLGPLDARWAVDETVLHALAGVRYPDPRLAPWLQRQGLRPVADLGAQDDAGLAALASAWEEAPSLLHTPIARYCGRDAEVLAQNLAQRMGLSLYRLQELPPPAEREAVTRLWAREALLHRGLLWVDLDAWEEGADAARAPAQQLAAWLDGLPSLVLLCARSEAARLPLRRAQRLLPSSELSTSRRLALWQDSLGADLSPAVQKQLPALAEQFQLSQTQVQLLARQWRASLDDHAGEDEHARAGRLWQAAREAAREAASELLRPLARAGQGAGAGGLDGLAQRIEARAQWADLVLPEPALHSLRSMAAQLRQRHRVYQSWGFAERSSRGLGLSALFSGGSGTGKTLAAEVLARELQLDLYRIDLASLVSKYIGETEKNLARVFAAAEASGAILLFDEADALFGKRSEVKDIHDRYANIEVSYLLQRVESYRGLAILTTNLKQAIDPAFQRRIRFIVQFPFPDEAARAAIWERAFPAAAPLGAIDIGKLMRLSLSGGHIRNLALNAAFLAADEDSVITMRHLREAAAAEFAKLERPLPAADVGDWL